MNKRKKILITIGAAITAIACGAIAVVPKIFSTENKSSITFTKVEKGNIESHIQSNGKIESTEGKNILVEVDSKIEKVYVKNGDSVKKDQVLIKLDGKDVDYKIEEISKKLDIANENLKQLKSELKINLENAKIKCDVAKKNYEEKKKLYDEGKITKLELDNIKSELDVSNNEYTLINQKYGNGKNGSEIIKQNKEIELLKMELTKAKQELEKYEIKSPIDGIVMQSKEEENSMVQRNTSLMQINSLGKLQITAYVNEYDASKLNLGNEVQITGDGFENKTYKGSITYIASFAKEMQLQEQIENVIEIKVDIKNGDSTLKVGLSTKLDILTKKKENALILPYEAILTKKDGTEVVFTAENGKIKENKIKRGIESDLNLEVISETLKEGSKVVVNPTENMKSGDVYK